MLVQHWRGERPLQRIFWIDLFAVTVLLALIGSVLASGLPGKPGARILFASVAATLLWSLWILVAVWRRGARSPLTGRLAAGALVLLWMLSPLSIVASLLVFDEQARTAARAQNAL